MTGKEPHLSPGFVPYMIVSLSVMDLSIKAELLKLPEENIGKSFHDLGEEVGKEFLKHQNLQL